MWLKHNRITRTVVPFVIAFVALVLVAPLLLGTQPVQAQQQDVAAPFVSTYWRYHGSETLGLVHSPLTEVGGIPAQYFEKGRLEDHSATGQGVVYGRVTQEMMEGFPQVVLANSNLTYGDIYRYSYSTFLPPAGFVGGTMEVAGGVFVPFDINLGPVPGYIVPFNFWNYITDVSRFPHGWLQDVGLPMTDIFEAQIIATDGSTQAVTIQAFERTILIFNPATGVVDRASIGTDMLLAQGYTPLYSQPARPTGPKRLEVNLTTQWAYAYEGDFMLYDFPVSTGKPGWETPAGSFSIFTKYVSQDMRGDANGETWYVPNVPHVMYFADGGYAFHGTYWHNTFGTGARLSHGCVNLPLDGAAILYDWAPIGTQVLVYY